MRRIIEVMTYASVEEGKEKELAELIQKTSRLYGLCSELECNGDIKELSDYLDNRISKLTGYRTIQGRLIVR